MFWQRGQVLITEVLLKFNIMVFLLLNSRSLVIGLINRKYLVSIHWIHYVYLPMYIYQHVPGIDNSQFSSSTTQLISVHVRKNLIANATNT